VLRSSDDAAATRFVGEHDADDAIVVSAVVSLAFVEQLCSQGVWLPRRPDVDALVLFDRDPTSGQCRVDGRPLVALPPGDAARPHALFRLATRPRPADPTSPSPPAPPPAARRPARSRSTPPPTSTRRTVQDLARHLARANGARWGAERR
jgi:hypothetical protein